MKSADGKDDTLHIRRSGTGFAFSASDRIKVNIPQDLTALVYVHSWLDFTLTSLFGDVVAQTNRFIYQHLECLIA
jgi:hypothetical protein